ncbi:MAG: tRNA (N6-isopentenyl adenosine(37)-C2)-methylthiotransferase MiaB [Firmicutes bacterium]|nr:tRNA (N6-isopentenyl adenosine(37)-C2)-methylthiotransferase MiaB [Bacillota bacterium]
MRLPNYDEAKNREKVEVKYLDVDNNINPVYINKKYFLRTYGCQMNVHDSEQIRFYLEKLGMTATDTLEQADVVVLNTCAIRENAHDKVIGYLGRCKHLKKKKPNLIIAVMGCMVGQVDVVEELRAKHDYVDIIVGTNNIYDLPKLLIEKKEKQNIEVYSNSDIVPENIIYERDSKISAWVNIMYGCDKFCTYCIVPFTRGRERSRKIECILKECKNLVDNGYQEITLLGQNVNAYGNDLNLGYDFADLLEQVAQLGIPRLRFVTSHPWNFTERMIDVIAKYKNIMPYIHLPIQSGSTRILKKMNRRYTKEEYQNLFDQMKKKIPNVAITTDIIVGFPGETEEDFLETLEIVNYCKYDGAYTFIYSERKGTASSFMKDDVSLEEKESRLKRLNEAVNKYSKESNLKLINKIVPVLVVGPSMKDKDKVYGYTDTMKLVNVEGGENLIGKIVDVKITDAKSFSLDGIFVN